MSDPAATPGTITVTGHGEVGVTPDALRLELAIEADAIGVADALAAARATMADLRRAVSEAGVAAADQQTVGLNVWQRHDDRTRRPNGYQANESLSVLLREPGVVDAVLMAAGEAAGDRLRIGGLGFVVLQAGAALDEARRLALADAERVAGVYATAAGREVGALVGLVEGGGTPIRSRRSKGGAELMAASDAGAEPGTQTIRADVTAEWLLH